jgi:hypothetical protein
MFGTLKGIFFGKIYYNVVSVAAGEKQGYTKQFLKKGGSVKAMKVQ